ncbi:MAG TPA: molybdate ABC transporter substrate-binding protein [Bellilinea sp.]|nr:molybdate ABC transporter substrate-binding protein [Bellilinea sp.]
MRKLIILILLILAAAAGCAPQPGLAEPETLTVSAASSLTEAFSEIGGLFESANPKLKVTFNFAGSQELAQQIIQGAAVDVFASANQKQMDVVLAELKLQPGAVKIFAANRLVVVYPVRNTAGLASLADLAKPGLKLVLAGAEVPVGQYSLDFLGLADASGNFPPGYQQAVLDNIVSYEQNVRAVLTKVALDEADAGIVYATDVGTANDQVGILEIPHELNIIARYPILALPGSQHSARGQTFVDFVLSPAGQQVLEKYGFSPLE